MGSKHLAGNGYPRTDTVPFIRVANSALIPKDAELEQVAVSASQGVAVAADVARDGGAVTKTLHWIATPIRALGQWLSWPFEESLAARRKYTENAFARLVQTKGPAEVEAP